MLINYLSIYLSIYLFLVGLRFELRIINQLFSYCSISLSHPYKENNFEMPNHIFVFVSVFFKPFSMKTTSFALAFTYSILWNKVLPDFKIANKQIKIAN
jgi:hypothetical protein